jgi:hypothetical protein
MKTIYISIIIIFTLLTGQATVESATKKATYPDNKSLQPIPQNVYPNVSGNVNMSVEDVVVEQEEESIAPNESKQDESIKIEAKGPSNIWWYILTAILLIIAFAIYYRKRNSTI